MATDDLIETARSPHRPEVGAFAPDVTVRDDSGRAVTFSDRWSVAPRGLILVFIRHFG